MQLPRGYFKSIKIRSKDKHYITAESRSSLGINELLPSLASPLVKELSWKDYSHTQNEMAVYQAAQRIYNNH